MDADRLALADGRGEIALYDYGIGIGGSRVIAQRVNFGAASEVRVELWFANNPPPVTA